MSGLLILSLPSRANADGHSIPSWRTPARAEPHGQGRGPPACRAHDPRLRPSDQVDMKRVEYMGNRMVTQIEQVLKDGKIVDNEDGLNVSRDYEHNSLDIVMDIRSSPAKRAENRKLVDALADFDEKDLEQAHTGRGVTYSRAARELLNSPKVVTSGQQAKKIGMICNKVAAFIDKVLAKQSSGRL